MAHMAHAWLCEGNHALTRFFPFLSFLQSLMPYFSGPWLADTPVQVCLPLREGL